MSNASKILDEIRLRRADPLLAALSKLTSDQRAYVDATNSRKLCQGGNRSGKTWVSTIDYELEALGLHPTLTYDYSTNWSSWVGWWATVSYKLFAEQTWDHFKRLLLYPGESVHRLPTRRIISIGWENKNPETPNYLRLKRDDGHVAEIYFKSYDQGRRAFQSAAPNRCHIDEECPRDIYTEITLRTLDRNGIVSISATPIEGASYLQELEKAAEMKTQDVFHVRLDTRNNPALDVRAIKEIENEFKHNPEMLRLRLQGYPIARQGLVYKDHIFTAAHVIDPQPIPGTWTRYFAADHGWRHVVGLWFAVSPDESQIWLYREYHGEERTVAENCKAIVELTGQERIMDPIIDRATEAASGLRNEVGDAKKVIDLYREETKWPFRPSPSHGVWSGIAECWKLLGQTREIEHNKPVPRFRVFRSCEYFLSERSAYRSKDVGDMITGRPEVSDNPIKAHDHSMDAWRYRVVAGMRYIEPPAIKPAQGTLGAIMVKRRHPARKPGL